ncbi:sensor histidine kinase [Streptantibioticus rubrisoli]|uniref:histidine kinase n=1 Tax=Streptantibioticus rubrisoli TaxID=1387313 RepID=A0ABT1PGF2_9ACTN|nr:histidine kinase [Streptantibioticus rubrisoli]MCQ4043288.1 histidine kinase [Streptantibioticus rubrisoli]
MPADNAATVADSPAISPDRAADTSAQPFGPLLRLPGLPRWWRPWGPVAVDVLVALACAAFDFDVRSAFAPGEVYGPLPSWVYGWLAVLAAASLIGRRRFPVWVVGLVTGGLLLGTGSVLTVVVAYYSLGRHARRTRTLCAVATAGLAAVVEVAALHLDRLAPGHGISGPAMVMVLVAVALIAVVVPVLAGVVPRVVPKQPWWWEHRRAMFFDLLLVLVYPMANPGGLLLTGASGSSRELLLPVPAVLVLVALQSIALVWRRRHPTVLTAIAIATVPLVLPPLSTLPVCLYSLAKYGRSRRHLLLACGAAVVVLVGWTAYLTGFAAQRLIPVAMFLVGLSVVVPVVFGMYRGAKRSLLISLREKAERLEREQHLLAAQARMQERTRIAREMHDVVSHRVSLMVVHAGALEAGAAGDNEVAVQTGQLIGQMGRQALNELRQVLGVLRMADGEDAASLAPQPTLDDVATLVEESRAAGMRIALDTVGDPSTVESTVQGALYRLVQEGLTNAHKHAGNAPVRVEVRRLPDAVRVIVENEAPAQPVSSQLPSGGHGLVGLGERVRVAGGTFEAGARPDGGFRITATIPTGSTPRP